MERQPGALTLSEDDRRVLAVWAADCAERTLSFFEQRAPSDTRPRGAIDGVRASPGACGLERFAREESAPPMANASSSGRGWDFDDAAIPFTEDPDIDVRRFHTEHREGGADLAPMIGPVVQRLGEPDAHGGVGLGPVATAPHEHGIRVEVLFQEP
jgi:hypothetical protein